jgi:hypothetical protein
MENWQQHGDIEYYDTFVNNSANAAGIGPNSPGGVQWHAVVSIWGPTYGSVDAIDNAPVTAPLYNMNGDLVANSSADLWDGTLQNPIHYMESGAIHEGGPNLGVYTGTLANGVGSDYRLPGYWATYGWDFATDSAWVYNGGLGAGIARSYYAISDPITAPGDATVPEPTTLAIWSLLGGHGLTIGWWRRRRAKA